jgi:hypothetical protein
VLLTVLFASLSVCVSYLMPCSDSYDQWTPGISGANSGIIGGWPLMNQYITIHDVANKRIGFAVAKSCNTGRQPLRANVTMGAAAPGYTPGSGSDTSTGLNAASSVAPGFGALAGLMAAVLILQRQ